MSACRPALALRLRRLLPGLLVLWLALVPAALLSQEAPLRQVDDTGALVPRPAPTGPSNTQGTAAPGTGAPGDETGQVDLAEWERIASRAEAAIADRAATSVALELLRAQLVEQRERLLGEQSANSARIATLRQQIAALGPAPAEGQAEADEIAQRRRELDEQLARLLAPGIAAEEGYRRADGLIREIDRVLRERQADELLRLWPAPINPANWPAGLLALSDVAVNLWSETAARWRQPEVRRELVDNLPAILACILFAGIVLWRGRGWIERLVNTVQGRASVRGRRIWALFVSLGQIVVPTLGVLALSIALQLSGLLGIVGTVISAALVGAGFVIFTAWWLGGRVFPKHSTSGGPLRLSAERRVEGRFLSTSFGLLFAVDMLRVAALDPLVRPETATAVLAFPILAVQGILLLRMGQLLRRHARNEAAADDGTGYRGKILGLLGRAAIAFGVVGPILAAVGYVSAARAMVYPAVLSLALLGLLAVLQRLAADIHAVITRTEDDRDTALVPVLVGFGLTLASLPLFALIWGARMADLTELWTRFREGFQMGETRISPTDFLFFAVIFGIGYMLTRVLQGALKASVLPRTGLDQGAQNATVSGVGYVGIFLAALIAINSTGIDLSGLAIVAGALSVGIGFGLQNIVSNFVSGIILLIERPVGEGDWIEVGGVQGTVKSISVRSTRIQTFDRTDVIVPNSDLVQGRVTNWTRFNLSGRLIVPVGVAFGTDTRKVERILREIAEAQPLAILNPPPLVVFMGFGADAMNFEIRVILRDVNFSLAVRSEINHMIVERFAAEGVEIPFAQSEITLRNAPEIAQALQASAAAALAAAPAVPRTRGKRHVPAAPTADHAPGEGLSPPSDRE